MPEVVDPINMHGDAEDVLRSLRRYVSQTLGSPPWTVRIQRTRVADDARPVAVIEQSSALTTSHARQTIPQGDVQRSATFTVVCYPGPLKTTAADARQQAASTMVQLDAGFTRGLVTDDVPPKNIGGPWRVPVYDFSQTPMSGPDRAGPTDPYMYANLGTGFNVRPVQDPLDELRFTVVATVPVTWWQGGRVPLFAPPATAGLEGTWRGSATP